MFLFVSPCHAVTKHQGGGGWGGSHSTVTPRLQLQSHSSREQYTTACLHVVCLEDLCCGNQPNIQPLFNVIGIPKMMSGSHLQLWNWFCPGRHQSRQHILLCPIRTRRMLVLDSQELSVVVAVAGIVDVDSHYTLIAAMCDITTGHLFCSQAALPVILPFPLTVLHPPPPPFPPPLPPPPANMLFHC